ncbi:glycoside hydrolase family 88 protein [Nonomuraea sp. NPDC003754]
MNRTFDPPEHAPHDDTTAAPPNTPASPSYAETGGAAPGTSNSCSAMYTYTISRAVERGHVDASYAAVAARGYQGVLAKVSLGADGRTTITDIGEGTNVDDVTGYYYGRARPVNDFHGLGAFLIMNEQLARVSRPS